MAVDLKRETLLAKKRERERLRRLADLEGVRARQRAQIALDPTKNRERARAWAQAHPEQMRERYRKWLSENRDKKNNTNRAWREANFEKSKSLIRDWRLRNPDKVRTQRIRDNHNRRAKQTGASGHATTVQINARVAFFGEVCSYCGGVYEHLDHATPLSRGGTNWPANLRPACRRCNLSKGSKTVCEFLHKKTLAA